MYAVFFSRQKGIRYYVLLEASDTLVGRMASVSSLGHPLLKAAAAADRFDRVDLVAAWFCIHYQRQLNCLEQN